MSVKDLTLSDFFSDFIDRKKEEMRVKSINRKRTKSVFSSLKKGSGVCREYTKEELEEINQRLLKIK